MATDTNKQYTIYQLDVQLYLGGNRCFNANKP